MYAKPRVFRAERKANARRGHLRTTGLTPRFDAFGPLTGVGALGSGMSRSTAGLRPPRKKRESMFDMLVTGFFSSRSDAKKTLSAPDESSAPAAEQISQNQRSVRKSFSPEHITHKSLSENNVKTSDVDMQLVTDRLICMGLPWANRTSKASRRNNVADISFVLNKYYQDLYLVFNLSNGKVYDLKPFQYQVLQFEPQRSSDIDQRGTPSLEEIFNVCYAIKFWLNLNHNNVAVLHCDNGIQRTKLFAACFLLFSGECTTIDEALLLFYRKRLRKPTFTMLDIMKNMSSSAKQVVSDSLPKTLLFLPSSRFKAFLSC